MRATLAARRRATFKPGDRVYHRELRRYGTLIAVAFDRGHGMPYVHFDGDRDYVRTPVTTALLSRGDG